MKKFLTEADKVGDATAREGTHLVKGNDTWQANSPQSASWCWMA
jgi:hypothetical protein